MKNILNQVCPGTSNAYIFEGFRCVYKRENGIWYKQTVECNMCGECCKRVSDNWWLGKTDEGWCTYLKYHEPGKYRCSANDTPFGCKSGDNESEDWCCVKWDKVD